MSLRVQKQIKLPSFVQGSSSDNAVSSDDVSSCDEYSDNCSSYDESSDNASYLDDDNDNPSFQESLHPYELDGTIAYGVVWFRLFGKWQSVPNEQWAWRYLVAVDDNGVLCRVWAPRACFIISLLFNLLTYALGCTAAIN